MKRTTLLALVAVSLSLAISAHEIRPPLAQAQQPAAQQQPRAAQARPRTAPRGRLPAYYGEVVSGEQRIAIYTIQQQYAPQIEKLQAELQALIAKRDMEVEGVLEPEQLKKVQELTEAARARRRGGAASESTPAAATPSRAAPQ